MSKHHLIISGTGCAGTTFLVQLLTELKPVLPNIGSDTFSRAFQKLSKSKLVHQFSSQEVSSRGGALISRLRKLVFP